ncbi:dysbindin (dystrobrevin binding protein 1) domain containing 1 [Cricetulus griseus]
MESPESAGRGGESNPGPLTPATNPSPSLYLLARCSRGLRSPPVRLRARGGGGGRASALKTCWDPAREAQTASFPMLFELRVQEALLTALLGEPLSSVSSLEVHFDLLDLTELTDMSDQELAEVFADSDDENLATESPAGLHPLSRAGCLRSPSWTKARAEQNRDKQPPTDPERKGTVVDSFLTMEGPKED